VADQSSLESRPEAIASFPIFQDGSNLNLIETCGNLKGVPGFGSFGLPLQGCFRTLFFAEGCYECPRSAGKADI
jgi:hypothetical protein